MIRSKKGLDKLADLYGVSQVLGHYLHVGKQYMYLVNSV